MLVALPPMVLAVALLLPAVGSGPARATSVPGAAAAGPAVAVVVRAAPGSGAAPADALRRLGGTVTRDLPMVDGFAATVPATALAALQAAPGVVAVTPDGPVHVAAADVPEDPAGAGSMAVAAAGSALAPRVVGAPSVWSQGVTGAGVTVALLDTGITDSPDLAGRVVPVKPVHLALGGPSTVPCANLSGEATCADTYGHGSFMAGLIAGRGGPSTGVAPGARLVSVKVAGASGAADVSTILAGIQWVVSFAPTYGITVLNLSLGTDSTQPWKTDPLNYAVEKAWRAGITVVVAASNNGPGRTTVAKPGDDPYVVTVGATDSRGTPAAGNDRVPDFSSRGPSRAGTAKPDVVAPGAHVLSLRSAGSTLQTLFPNATPGRYRTGSGTSMSTAVVSGVVALMLQADPGMTPDQVKYALVHSTRPGPVQDRAVVGAGAVDAVAAALHPPLGVANQGLLPGNGTGAIGLSRGTQLMQVPGLLGPVLLQGRQTAQLRAWDATDLLGDWDGASWYLSGASITGWNTASWAGTPFSGHDWTGHDWTGSSWQGTHESSSSYGRHSSGAGSYGGWD